MSHRLGARLYQWSVTWPAPVRYSVLSLATTYTIISTRPKAVFVQNPSLVLAIVAGLVCKPMRTALIVDAHNGGLFPFEGKKPWATRLAKFALRLADFTIVTNPSLATYVDKNSGRAIVVPDPLPDFLGLERHKNSSTNGPRRILFICTWAEDEPYLEVLEAAKSVVEDVRIRVTGNYAKRSDELPEELPENVTLLGYVNEKQYIDELLAADITIDLTTRDDCLVCGAYESVALGIPAILSDTAAIRSYFSKGIVYTGCSEEDIAMAIDRAVASLGQLRGDVLELREEIESEWDGYKVELLSKLQGQRRDRAGHQSATGYD